MIFIEYKAMIKTSYKQKLGKGLTHSLGSKGISEILEGVRVYDELSIAFDKFVGHRMGIFVPGRSGVSMKGESRDLLAFKRVISGKYSSNLGRWMINLEPVSIEINQQVKEFLVQKGLPLLRGWLDAKRDETWYNGSRYFTIGLNENLTKFCLWETYNDRTVKKKIESL